ncbi:hypothetical protein [Olleya sp. HaHaR_3_96]|uniref:hypothetical protein n=1 Tax=Olleya sp. HaHaR_3_96 TaxID=2745560 RepID=UPI001C4FAD30|nr:hypothetical protein [Olleya sp. HaHaR_3_96]QXP59015.1 hypothetical protein H0I26_13965 [Olleya sp. HaHaR_3_96]
MNTIKAEIDKSDYGTDEFLNLKIDGFWLDEKLEELYPNNMYKGLYPTLLFAMEIAQEEKVVWNRISPKLGEIAISPILMCPDDNDFSCTLILAEIENCKNTIKWNKLGIDKTTEYDAEKVGFKVEWFEKISGFEFSKDDYENMLSEFKKHYLIEKTNWDKRNPEFKQKIPFEK